MNNHAWTNILITELINIVEAEQKDTMILTLRLIGEDPDTFSPEVTEVMERWEKEIKITLNSISKNEKR